MGLRKLFGCFFGHELEPVPGSGLITSGPLHICTRCGIGMRYNIWLGWTEADVANYRAAAPRSKPSPEPREGVPQQKEKL